MIPSGVWNGVTEGKEGNEEENSERNFSCRKKKQEAGTVLGMFLESQHCTVEVKESRGMRKGLAWAT